MQKPTREEQSKRAKALAQDRKQNPAKYKAPPTRVDWEGHRVVTRCKIGGKWKVTDIV
jgi:hypothetical protein